MGKPKNTLLPLSEAILAWSPTRFIDEIRANERLCSRNNLTPWRWPRLVSDAELRKPAGNDWMSGGSSSTKLLHHAWVNLENEFRRLVRAGELYLCGVKVKPELTTEPQLIPGAWASELRLDLIGDAVMLSGQKFASVRVSRAPLPLQGGSPVSTGTTAPPNWAFETMGEWSDDQVLALFEEHVRRVVESEPAKLSEAFGGLSLMPIIVRKMRARFEAQENGSSLAEESMFLAEWIKQKAPLLHCPKASSIETKLRSDYRALKAGSKPNN